MKYRAGKNDFHAKTISIFENSSKRKQIGTVTCVNSNNFHLVKKMLRSQHLCLPRHQECREFSWGVFFITYSSEVLPIKPPFQIFISLLSFTLFLWLLFFHKRKQTIIIIKYIFLQVINCNDFLVQTLWKIRLRKIAKSLQLDNTIVTPYHF